MKFAKLSVLCGLAALASAIPASKKYVVHEKRSATTSWTPKNGAKVDGRINLPVRIGLTESNLHLGDNMLIGVSDPNSANFGNHLTTEQVSVNSLDQILS